MKQPLPEAAGKAFSSPFGAVLEQRPEGGDPLFVDGRCEPPAIASALPDDQSAADCTWRGPADMMGRTLASNRAVENAVINGRISISGDMSVMARLEMTAA